MSGFDINNVTLSGNLTDTPKLRELSETAVCSMRIAHNERFKTSAGEWDDRPQYFDVTIWGGLGEWIAANVSKGQKVVVSGRLRWREWDAKEGGKRQAVDITADSVIPVRRTDPAPAATEAEAEAEKAPATKARSASEGRRGLSTRDAARPRGRAAPAPPPANPQLAMPTTNDTHDPQHRDICHIDPAERRDRIGVMIDRELIAEVDRQRRSHSRSA